MISEIDWMKQIFRWLLYHLTNHGRIGLYLNSAWCIMKFIHRLICPLGWRFQHVLCMVMAIIPIHAFTNHKDKRVSWTISVVEFGHVQIFYRYGFLLSSHNSWEWDCKGLDSHMIHDNPFYPLIRTLVMGKKAKFLLAYVGWKASMHQKVSWNHSCTVMIPLRNEYLITASIVPLIQRHLGRCR